MLYSAAMESVSASNAGSNFRRDNTISWILITIIAVSTVLTVIGLLA